MTGLLLLAASALFAHTPLCAPSLRSLGTEWELASFPMTLEAAGIGTGETMLDIIARSQLSELYGIYGRNAAGQWVANLIPESVVADARFAGLAAAHGARFERRDGRTYLTNYADLGSRRAYALIEALMTIRGETNDTLSLRRRPGAWRAADPLDALLPERLAEEWRSGQFIGLEFPMEGGVHMAGELRSYFRHLWLRLGLFRPGDPALERALDFAIGHVHWVPNVPGIARPQRAAVYEGILRFWGDANDRSTLVSHGLDYPLDSGHRMGLDIERAETALAAFGDQASSSPIRLLTRELYGTVRSSADGVVFAEPERANDRNGLLGEPLKLLPVALRARYPGNETHRPGQPIPFVGLETRLGTAADNLRSTPAVLPRTSHVDVAALTSIAAGERGVVGSPVALRARATALRIDPRVVDQFDSVLPGFIAARSARFPDAARRVNWTPEQMRALALLPLTEWLQHPLVRSRLDALGTTGRAAAVARYEAALGRYRTRLNDLARARADRTYTTYRPDWTSGVRNPPDGLNLVFPGERGRHDADSFYLLILVSESYRFGSESGLADLVR